MNKEEIFVNEKFWRGMDSTQLIDFTFKIFDYYRKTGFPYYPTSPDYRKREFIKMMMFDRSTLFENDVVKQSMHGLGLAWSYFPHAFNVKCGDKMTPYEAFMDDNIFLNVIKKRLKMGTYISDSGIRKMLKIYTGVQGVSNFRPTAAAAIYDTFAKNGAVWDMSGGWGGRLLGAIASGVESYYATEPSQLAFEGLENMVKDFASNKDYKIFQCGSETWLPERKRYDLCFTSPPYFDLEKYSDEDTQSYIAYPNRESWLHGFLKSTFRNCRWGLKDDGIMAINLANIKGYNLEDDMVKVAEDVGFRVVKKLKLALSNVNLRAKENKFKYEPIYVFTKR